MRVVGILIAFVATLCASVSAQDLVYYFPQIADGTAGDQALATEFTITSASGEFQTTVTLSCYSDNGAAWVADLYSVDRPDAGGFKSSTTFTLGRYETVHFVTRAIDELAVGWAILTASHPVLASVSYQSVRTDLTPVRPQWVAGVLPTPATVLALVDANVSANDLAIGNPEVDVGFAIANPNELAADVSVEVLTRTGTQAGIEHVYVPGRGHAAMFISELLKNVAWGGRFHGHVRFACDIPVAVLALKETTLGGSIVYSTLSVTPWSELLRRAVYEREDNSTFAKAQPIAAPAEIIGKSDSGDADYFSFQIAPEDIGGTETRSCTFSTPTMPTPWCWIRP